MQCFINGSFVDVHDAKVSISDIGFLRAYGCFEVVRCYDGHLFHLDTHLLRLASSSALLGLQLPHSQNQLTELCQRLVLMNHLENAKLRIILTGGVSDSDFEIGSEPTCAIIPYKLNQVRCQPLKTATSVYERHLPESKTLNYLPALVERKKVRLRGFDEPLFTTPNGNVLEGARENFFAVKGRTLITPKTGILHGVTRKVVLDIAREDFEIEERPLHVSELASCDGAFLTSTVKEIAPIVQIDALEFQIPESINLLTARFKDSLLTVAQK